MTGDFDRIIKPMVYGAVNDHIIAYGIYKGVQYAVVNFRGSHPCGYVNIGGHKSELEVNGLFSKFGTELFDWIDCHGGITYARPYLESFDGGFWIGWDYAHLNDYVYGIASWFYNARKYTVNEIVSECKIVIDQIVEKLDERATNR